MTTWATTLPPKISNKFRGCAERTFKCDQTSETFGRNFAAASLRHRGTANANPATTPAITTIRTMSHTNWAWSLPLEDGSEKCRLLHAIGRAIKNSAPLTIQLAVLTIAPELTATVASYPCF